MPFALDNDAFGAWKSGLPWDENAWLHLLDTVAASGLPPRWILVPDVVARPGGKSVEECKAAIAV